MNDYFCIKYLFMYHRELSEQAIISGFRKGDANIIREYSTGIVRQAIISLTSGIS